MSNQTGLTAELEVASKLTRLGFAVSMPLGDHQAYDLIADDGTKLWRVQVKRAVRVRDECLRFTNGHPPYNSGANRGAATKVKYTPEEIDCIVVWYADADTFYWIPADFAYENFGSAGYLWLGPGKSASKKRVLAKQFEICNRNTFQ